MTTTQTPAKARQMMSSRTIAQLVEQYELTDKLMDGGPLSREDFAALVAVRGWIMEELETRGDEGDKALLAICGITEW